MISPALVLQESSRFLLLVLWVCGQRVCVVQAKRHIHSPRRRLDFVRAGAPRRHRHLVVHRLVRAPKIVKGHPGTDAGPRLAGVGISFQMHFSYLIERHSRSMKMLSMKRPRPSIEIATQVAASLPAKASAVNVEPYRY